MSTSYAQAGPSTSPPPSRASTSSTPAYPPRTPPRKSRRTTSVASSSTVTETPSGLSRFLPRTLFASVVGEDWERVAERERIADQDASSIDWSHEYAKERNRKQLLAQVKGIRGVKVRLWDLTIPWLVVVATGIGTGAVASSLDILSAWLSDLRMGSCRGSWWMSRSSCCAGLDRGEICRAWRSWGELVANENHLILQAITQYTVYITFAVLFAVLASFFVQVYAPFAFHTGIPEIKTILGGYIIKGYLSPIVLLIKSLDLPLAVASGLSLGKEGPLVHVACCIGNFFLTRFSVLRGNEARQREILSAAAAAGVSVAFGAPLGGVLFSLEEISTYFPGSTLWQSFVCAVVAAVTLQYIDPFNTGRLVLFQVTTSQIWRGFELIPWLFLGVLGGIWGHCFIQLNKEWERMRRSTIIKDYPVYEVGLISLFTAVISYLILFMKIPSAELVANLFQDCSEDSIGLCDTNHVTSLVFTLCATAFAKTLLTAVTFGASIPAGIFLPSLTIGACVGRAVGILMASLQRNHPTAWLFANCPADFPCISPPVYAVIGAASALGGVTRMTISLTVILFELTGAIDLVLQIMMAVMVAKFTGDFFSKEGIYETWINLRAYPFLNNKIEYRRDTILGKHVMTPQNDIVCLDDEGWSIAKIENLLESEEFRGYPILRTRKDKIVIGYIARLELEAALHDIGSIDEVPSDTSCYFTHKLSRGRQIGSNAPKSRDSVDRKSLDSKKRATEKRFPANGLGAAPQQDWISLKEWVDEIPILVNENTPMEIIVQMFQRMGLRTILLTNKGALAGILTKMDIHAHIHSKLTKIPSRNSG